VIRRIVGFSLYYGLGVGSALAAMLTVLPAVRYGGDARPTADRAVQHALLVQGPSGCPAFAMAEAAERCPYLARVTARSQCPYLAAVSARSACPYIRDAAEKGRCPYLDRRPGGDTDATRRSPEPRGHGFDAPEQATPEVNWMPDGTVLARLDAARPAPTASTQS
jgi:hypothetical protein